MDASLPRLVVVRGNGAAGKTTLAREVQRGLGPGAANIGQDHFRRVVLGEHDVPGGDNIGLIGSTVRYCLRIGYHVVLEGILGSDHYGEMLRGLLGAHRGPSHVIYLDVPLAETLRRHEGRALRAEIAPEQLREWYAPSDLLGVPDEVVIDGTGDLASVVRSVRDCIGPIPERPDLERARFL